MTARKTTKKTEELSLLDEAPTTTVAKPATKANSFTVLIQEISRLQSEFENLQKELFQTREAWDVEQKAREKEVADRRRQEDLARQREHETYEYETDRRRKQAEDEFSDRKLSWEKALNEQKETLAKEREELAELRKTVSGFETEKEKAVTTAQASLHKELAASFEVEKKLREQETKSEKEILNLKIANLTSENTRQLREIEALKKSLEDATRQIKEVAVKVIESGSPSKPPLDTTSTTRG